MLSINFFKIVQIKVYLLLNFLCLLHIALCNKYFKGTKYETHTLFFGTFYAKFEYNSCTRLFATCLRSLQKSNQHMDRWSGPLQCDLWKLPWKQSEFAKNNGRTFQAKLSVYIYGKSFGQITSENWKMTFLLNLSRNLIFFKVNFCKFKDEGFFSYKINHKHKWGTYLHFLHSESL